MLHAAVPEPSEREQFILSFASHFHSMPAYISRRTHSRGRSRHCCLHGIEATNCIGFQTGHGATLVQDEKHFCQILFHCNPSRVLRKYRTIKVVGWRVNFLSGADADFAGLLAVNQENSDDWRKRHRQVRRRIVRYFLNSYIISTGRCIFVARHAAFVSPGFVQAICDLSWKIRKYHTIRWSIPRASPATYSQTCPA